MQLIRTCITKLIFIYLTWVVTFFSLETGDFSSTKLNRDLYIRLKNLRAHNIYSDLLQRL